MRSNSTYSRRGGRAGHLAANAAMRASRRSLTSIKSAGSGTPLKRPVSRARRGVNFNHHANSLSRERSGLKRGPASIAGDDTTYGRDHMSPASPCRQSRFPPAQSTDRPETRSLMVPRLEHTRPHGNEELRQLSQSIAQDCDQAFNSSLLSPDTYVDRASSIEPSSLSPSMLDFSQVTGSSSLPMSTPTPAFRNNEASRDTHKWDARPLPVAPPPTDSVLREIRLAKKRTAHRETLVDESPGHLLRMKEHLDKLLPPGDSEADSDQRSISAPLYSQYSTQWGKDAFPLPSILEGGREPSSLETGKPRTVSAPTGNKAPIKATPGPGRERNALNYLARQENTIRMVMSPGDGGSPVKIPAPLNIRKKPSIGSTMQPPPPPAAMNLRQQYAFDEITEAIPEEPPTPSVQSMHSPIRKKSSWFKRGSKDKDDLEANESSNRTSSFLQSNTSTDSTGIVSQPAKKRSFSLAFWRNSNKGNENLKLSVAGMNVSLS